MVDLAADDPDEQPTDEQPTDEQSSDQQSRDAKTAGSEWERKRRLAEIFGDVLPATTGDERDPGESPARKESAQDAWLRSQVPPHHGS